MKATISPDVLLKELKSISAVIKKNTVLPILDCVLFRFDKNKLKITGTDLETTYISTIECECKNKFAFPMSFNSILDVCSNVVTPIEIELTETAILIKSGKSKFSFSLSGKLEDFQIIQDEDFKVELEVDGDFFFNLYNANAFRSKEELKVNLNMAAIDIQKSVISLIGTDANYLYKKDLNSKSKYELIVMVCDSFIQSCKSFQESKISIGEKFIKAEYKDEIVISRLSENKFANYKSILPTENIFNLTIDKNELKSALRSVNVGADVTTRQCVFNFTDKGINLVSQDIDFGKDAEYNIEIEHNIEIDKICVNSNQLSLLLSHIEGDSVDFAFSAPNKTIFLKPTYDDTLLCLLQPLFLNN